MLRFFPPDLILYNYIFIRISQRVVEFLYKSLLYQVDEFFLLLKYFLKFLSLSNIS